MQRFVTVAGMVAVITAVLAGSTVGLLLAVTGGPPLLVTVGSGVVVGVAVLVALMRYQAAAWDGVRAEHPFTED